MIAAVSVVLLSNASGIWAYVHDVLPVLFAALPIGLGVGILKYRLYDIDRLISRTLSYAIVTGLVVGVYAGVVTLVTRVLGFSSPVAVAASTLAAVALFNPLRVRVQRVVDRRFNRARYDAEATLGGLHGAATGRRRSGDSAQRPAGGRQPGCRARPRVSVDYATEVRLGSPTSVRLSPPRSGAEDGAAGGERAGPAGVQARNCTDDQL